MYLAGPGIGTGRESVTELDALINGSGMKPLVLDADALTILSSDEGRYLSEDIRRQTKEGREIILTPHEGELRRLLKVIPEAVSDGDRLSLGIAVSDYFGCTVAAKGPDTYVITPGRDIIVNDEAGNSGMATAGSGDVLSGIIGAFLGFRKFDSFESAVRGVHLHAVSGDRAYSDLFGNGLTAGDIIEHITY